MVVRFTLEGGNVTNELFFLFVFSFPTCSPFSVPLLFTVCAVSTLSVPTFRFNNNRRQDNLSEIESVICFTESKERGIIAGDSMEKGTRHQHCVTSSWVALIILSCSAVAVLSFPSAPHLSDDFYGEVEQTYVPWKISNISVLNLNWGSLRSEMKECMMFDSLSVPSVVLYDYKNQQKISYFKSLSYCKVDPFHYPMMTIFKDMANAKFTGDYPLADGSIGAQFSLHVSETYFKNLLVSKDNINNVISLVGLFLKFCVFVFVFVLVSLCRSLCVCVVVFSSSLFHVDAPKRVPPSLFHLRLSPSPILTPLQQRHTDIAKQHSGIY